MKRKSSKAWIITTIMIALLVLIFAMVGCTGGGGKDDDKDKDKGTDTTAALTKVITAADKTLGKIKDSDDTISLGLSIGVKAENLKLKINEKGVDVNFDNENFDVKVKVGANLSKTTDNNEILAEIMSGNALKLGVYSKNDVVYIQDGVTTTSTKKIKVSGAKAVGYNQYIDDLPGILQNALKDLDLSGLADTLDSVKSLVNGLITTKTTTDGYSFDIVFVSDKEGAGLAPILENFADALEFGEPYDGLIGTFLPYILGGNFKDFGSKSVKVTSKVTLDVGIKNDMLTGVKIGIDLDPLKNSTIDKVKNGVGGKITIEIGDLVIDNKKTDILPNDLNDYQEGALTANLALDVPKSPKDLQLYAKIEFSPSLNDKDLKVKVVAMDKDKNEVDLKGGYVNFGTDESPDYAIVFDMKYLYKVAGVPDSEIPTDTKYRYSMNIGAFLKNLITSQRVFVFFDEDNQNWHDSNMFAEFFKTNGAEFTAKDLTDITPRVKAYYANLYNCDADELEVEYRFSDGTLALDKNGTGDFTKRKAELGYNLNITAIVNVPEQREYVTVTFNNDGATAGAKKVVVRKSYRCDISHFAPEYTVADGRNLVGWTIDGTNTVDLTKLEITDDTTITFKTEDVSQKQKVVFERYDMDAGKYVDYEIRYYDKEAVSGAATSAKNGTKFEEDIPDVPYIFGMEGKWIVISDQGYRVRGEFEPQTLTKDSGTLSTFVSNEVVTVYPVYQLATNADDMWKTVYDYNDVNYWINWIYEHDYTINWSEVSDENHGNIYFWIDWITQHVDKKVLMTAADYNSWMIEQRFTRKTLKEGKIDSIVEAGDPSLVGQNVVNTILDSLGDIFGIIKNKSVDAKFVAKIMGAISPYLGSPKLIADRIMSAFVDYDIVQYPYVMPSVKNGNATVSATSVAAITDGSTLLNSEKQSGTVVTKCLTRCQEAVIWSTYQRFVGIYGNLDMDDEELVAKLCWTPAQVTAYKNAADAQAKAEKYVENEENSYDEKVKVAQAAFDADKAEFEEIAIGIVAGILGNDALGGAGTVEEAIFGGEGIDPLRVAFEFKDATETTGYGVTIMLMRGDTTIASIGGDVFFSYASAITDVYQNPDKADFKDVTDGSILEELMYLANVIIGMEG